MKVLKYLLAVMLFSCGLRPKVHNNLARCAVRYDSLFQTVDTSNLEILKNTDSAAIEVLDKRSQKGDRGLFRFDSKGNLKFYAFLVNYHNDYEFSIVYDSLGNRKRSTTGEVVHWFFFKRRDSALRFEFLLCAVDFNYADIKVEAGSFVSENVRLFESDFVKLIGAEIRIPSMYLVGHSKIYVSGMKQDKCTKIESSFIDSATIPSVR